MNKGSISGPDSDGMEALSRLGRVAQKRNFEISRSIRRRRSNLAAFGFSRAEFNLWS